MEIAPTCDTNRGMSSERPEPWGSVSGRLVSMRLPQALVTRAERLRRYVGEDKPATRSRVLRDALALGLDALEARRKKERNR